MTISRSFLAVLLMAFSWPLFAATEVLNLNYQLAEDVLPVAQAVVGDQGRVTAYGNQLIVNAPDGVIEQLRQTLAQLDKQPRQLLISIDRQDSANARNSGYRVDGLSSPGEAGYQPGYPGERDQVRIIRRNTSSQDSGVQQVQATEGYPALIQVGQRVPLNNTSSDVYGQYYSDTQYHDVMRGFYATAVITGDAVQVTLSSQNDRVNRNHRNVLDLQNTETRVSGKLGEWIDFAGNNENSSNDRSGILNHYSSQGQQSYSLRLKVDVLD
ncbi:secretin N-terminal domain-containing protein [Azomonas macrocytogenes]|uniref:NolW-like domain-containing protein n=1 Tax=Azomonas macrocytogenes TaxID=69962 RepID=A0A839SXK6_AZOMA|nr:secretin N-terminal domain-containing protein [Azomonas macrocytogenes]MBB3101648.1 hypothetical protein [Azomonas macrocytogenes]